MLTTSQPEVSRGQGTRPDKKHYTNQRFTELYDISSSEEFST